MKPSPVEEKSLIPVLSIVIWVYNYSIGYYIQDHRYTILLNVKTNILYFKYNNIDQIYELEYSPNAGTPEIDHTALNPKFDFWYGHFSPHYEVNVKWDRLTDGFPLGQFAYSLVLDILDTPNFKKYKKPFLLKNVL